MNKKICIFILLSSTIIINFTNGRYQRAARYTNNLDLSQVEGKFF